MTDKINFTKAALDALPTPEKGKRKSYWDTKKDGLQVRISDTGSKVFYVYRWFNGKPKRVKIGKYPDWSIEQARKEADVILGKMAREIDPNEKRWQAKKEMTFAELFEWYLECHAKPLKKTWEQDEAQYKRYLSDFAKLKLSEISKEEIRAIHAKIGGKHGHYTANRLLALISAVFNKGINQELIQINNPARGIQRFREQKRARYIGSGEIGALYKALEEEPNQIIKDFILLSIYTGQRRSNVQAMRWDQINLDERTWTIPETKNGSLHIVPLEDAEIKILTRRKKEADGPWVFPGSGASGHLIEPKKTWKRILERAGISNVRIHDLRRTHGSWMVNTGASLATIGDSLNQKSLPTTQIYARIAQPHVREAKKRALEAISKAVEGPTSTRNKQDDCNQ